MRSHTSLGIAILVVTLGLFPARGQNIAPPIRDQAAISVLESAFAAAGGKNNIKGLQDFTATGTIIYSWSEGEVQGNVRILAKGLDQARMDVQLPDRENSIVLSHGSGSVSDHTGSHNILSQNAKHMGLLIFTLPSVVQAVDDPRTSISFDAGNNDMGCNGYRVQIVQPIHAALQNDLKFRQLRTVKLCVEQTSFMVTQFVHPLMLDNRHHVVLARQLIFADFRNVSGLVMPFSVEEKQSGQHLSTLHLSTCQLNSGVLSSVFTR